MTHCHCSTVIIYIMKSMNNYYKIDLQLEWLGNSNERKKNEQIADNQVDTRLWACIWIEITLCVCMCLWKCLYRLFGMTLTKAPSIYHWWFNPHTVPSAGAHYSVILANSFNGIMVFIEFNLLTRSELRDLDTAIHLTAWKEASVDFEL